MFRLQPNTPEKCVTKKRERMNLEEIKKRLIGLEDQEEIKKLHQHYISLMDNLKYDEIPDLFTTDAMVEIRSSGIKKGIYEITELYSEISKRRKDVKEGHMVLQPNIIVEGEKAFGSWMVYILFSKPSVQWVQGVNECEYVKKNAKWKFRKIKFLRKNASKEDMFP